MASAVGLSVLMTLVGTPRADAARAARRSDHGAAGRMMRRRPSVGPADRCRYVGTRCLYNALLRLYPASFRNEYGEEMRPLFARRRAQASGFGIVTLWLGTIGEVVANAAAVHLDILKQDVSYTGRVLRRSPGFAVTAVLIVALGVGATTAAFSITDFVLLRPLPFPEPDRLVTLWEHMPTFRQQPFAGELPRLDEREHLVRTRRDLPPSALEHDRHRRSDSCRGRVRVGRRSAHPRRLAVDRAARSPTQTTAPARRGTMLLGYRFWQTQFGGDPAVIGRKVLMDDEPFTVIGVMPREFTLSGRRVVLVLDAAALERTRVPPIGATFVQRRRSPAPGRDARAGARGDGRHRRPVAAGAPRGEQGRVGRGAPVQRRSARSNRG